ncbi:outer membrane efflux protein [Tenacibaculum skagerrakense]|uniref:Outer membrane efflux protein n=1 Tax=Tenacibaculum skagerrakense TaxID=186571 RepID=A0A4R2NUU1_9FLAO|nr:TolC family protein [Tenacibaculum skagerrakense]TCP25853.1 outer membrane efflux protein [Tenacibaculum skagerrakense]
MNKHITLTLCVCLFYLCLNSQNNYFNDILHQIELNNIELKAFKSFKNSEKLKIKSSNNLSDPTVIGYFLPFSSQENSSNYTEFEVTQSFDFPSLYGARKEWINLKSEEFDIKYNELKQNVLLKANKLLVKVIYLRKIQELQEKRHLKSKKVYHQVLELYNKEQIGILELNKVKIAWMQVKFQVKKTELEINSLLKELSSLNGDKAITLDKSDYLDDYLIDDFSSLWNSKLKKDASLQIYSSAENSSLQQITVEKRASLPKITLGYNNQGVSGNRVSGFLGGLTIPLWKHKNKVKAAKQYHQSLFENKSSKFSESQANYFHLYNKYSGLYKKYIEYKTTLTELDSEKLLDKAYELGEISFIDYHHELDFYHKAIDEMLEMELELQLLKTEIYKHTL